MAINNTWSTNNIAIGNDICGCFRRDVTHVSERIIQANTPEDIGIILCIIVSINCNYNPSSR